VYFCVPSKNKISLLLYYRLSPIKNNKNLHIPFIVVCQKNNILSWKDCPMVHCETQQSSNWIGTWIISSGFDFPINWLLFLYTLVYNVCTMCFVMHTAGQQEYSSRQAGITTGIVLACLIPILLIVICVGYRALKSRKEDREQEEILARYRTHFTTNSEVVSCTRSRLKSYDRCFRTRQAELQRLRKIGEDEESIPYSPSKATEIN